MARKLAATVVVGGVAYKAGDVPPHDVAEQITNPAAWEGEESSESAESPISAGSEVQTEDETPRFTTTRKTGSTRRSG